MKKNTKSLFTGAFTLLELLLVIGIISTLSSIIVFSLRPAEIIANSNNSKRRANINDVKNALEVYQASNSSLPISIPQDDGGNVYSDCGDSCQICTYNAAGCSGVDLDFLVPQYLSQIPTDPQNQSSIYSGYYVFTHTGRADIGLIAPLAQNGESIAVNAPIQASGASGPGSQGPISGSSGANVGSTGYNWSNLNNSSVSDNQRVVNSYCIMGVFTDYDVRLIKNGVPVGNNKSTLAAWGSTVNYGGANDLWGITWTPAEINTSNFGARIGAAYDPVVTNVFQITGFNFSIPTTATINGITLTVEQEVTSCGIGRGYPNIDLLTIKVDYTV